jgi:hypothetical protein
MNKKMKIQYHSEIKEHHDLMEKEFKLNPADCKWLCRKGKVIGRIKGMIKLNKEVRTEIRKIDEKGVLQKDIITELKPFYKFNIAEKGFLFLRVGSIHITLPEKLLEFDYNKSRVNIESDVNLEYYKGYFTSTEQESKIFTDMEFFKTLRDKDIDGVGNQAKRYSEVRAEWSHDIDTKDKEIEKLKEERKLSGTKAR